MLQMLNQSEREFEERFEALCNRRVEKEQVYASIKNTPSRNLLSRFFSAEEEKAAAKILDKLIANSSNDSIVSEARLLLKEKK